MLSRTAVPLIMFLGKDLLTVDSAKDLGVVLDSQLSFNEHINSLVSSLMSKLCMVNRISHLLDHSTLTIVINLLVFGKLFYCSCIWSGTSNYNISKLQLVQNVAVYGLGEKDINILHPH